MYVEDLKGGSNKEVGPKDIFEMGSNKEAGDGNKIDTKLG